MLQSSGSKLLPEKWSVTTDTVVHPHFEVVKIDPAKGLKTPTRVKVRNTGLIDVYQDVLMPYTHDFANAIQ